MYKFILIISLIYSYVKLNKCCENSENLTCVQAIYLTKNCSHETIILLNYESDDKDWESIISRYNKNIVKFKNTCLDLAGTKQVSDSSSNSYVINFRVEDYYNNFNKTIADGLIYAGENNDNKNSSIKSVKVIDEKLCNNYPKACDEIFEIPNTALQDLNTTPQTRNILSCTNDIIMIMVTDRKDYKIIKSNMDNCKDNMIKYEHDLEAIISARPFNLDIETNIPTLFYVCLIEEDSNLYAFVNSAWKFCNNIEYVYLELLHIMSWERVAIVSDYSEFSNMVDERFMRVFDSEHIVYGLEKCTEDEDDLKRILKRLIHVDARIIILNTDRLTTEALFKQVDKLNMLDSKYVWITRNFTWPSSITKIPEMIFDISPDKSITIDLQKFYKGPNETRSKSIRRQITDKLLESIDSRLSFVIKGPENFEVNIQVSNSDVKSSGMNTFLNHRIKDTEICYLKGANFYNPCNEVEFYLILGVLLIFSISLLVISTFFIELDMRYRSEYESQRLL